MECADSGWLLEGLQCCWSFGAPFGEEKNVGKKGGTAAIYLVSHFTVFVLAAIELPPSSMAMKH